MLKWKQNLKQKALAQFERNKKVNWSKFIYESNSTDAAVQQSRALQNDGEAEEEEEEEDDGPLFRVRRPQQASSSANDNAKYLTRFNEWNSADSFDTIRDCFVTGKWDKKSDAKHLLNGDDNDDNSDVWDAFDEPYEPESGDEELYGDFEDMETGQVYKANGNNENGKKRKAGEQDEDEKSTGDNEDDEDNETGEEDEEDKTKKSGDLKIRKKPKSEMTKRERLLEKKKRLKEQFDRGIFIYDYLLQYCLSSILKSSLKDKIA